MLSFTISHQQLSENANKCLEIDFAFQKVENVPYFLSTNFENFLFWKMILSRKRLIRFFPIFLDLIIKLKKGDFVEF